MRSFMCPTNAGCSLLATGKGVELLPVQLTSTRNPLAAINSRFNINHTLRLTFVPCLLDIVFVLGIKYIVEPVLSRQVYQQA